MDRTNYKMRKWVWQRFQRLYGSRRLTQEHALTDLIPYIKLLTWSDLKPKTRKVKMPPETKKALKEKVDDINGQLGNTTTIMAVLLCAIDKMLVDEGDARADDAIEARKLTPAELAQQFEAFSPEDRRTFAKMITKK
jgi:hypothetical protein